MAVGKKYPPSNYWPTDKRYPLEVVGESFRNDSFANIECIDEFQEADIYCDADLVPNPLNESDTNAVEVRVQGLHIGFLSRQDALKYKESAGEFSQRATECKALIQKRIYDGDAVYSVWLAVDLTNPPKGTVALRPKRRRPKAIPLWGPSLFVSDGRLMMVFGGVDHGTASGCFPGDEVNTWRKPESEDIFMYAPSSIGGSGRIGVIEESTLNKVGLSLETFSPVVFDASCRVVILGANLPMKAQ